MSEPYIVERGNILKPAMRVTIMKTFKPNLTHGASTFGLNENSFWTRLFEDVIAYIARLRWMLHSVGAFEENGCNNSLSSPNNLSRLGLSFFSSFLWY